MKDIKFLGREVYADMIQRKDNAFEDLTVVNINNFLGELAEKLKETDAVHRIKFPIGDWSDDGHGKCGYFMVESDKPVEDVREAHFKSKEVLGFGIGDICKDHEEAELKPEHKEKLEELGYNMNVIDDDEYVETGELIDIWLFLLNHIDKDLNLKTTKSDIPSISFYGFDDKKRHLETPGYGLF